MIAPNASRYADFTHHFVRFLPTFADAGWAGTFYLKYTIFTFILSLPNGNINTANVPINELINNYTDFTIAQRFLHLFLLFLNFLLKFSNHSIQQVGMFP